MTENKNLTIAVLMGDTYNEYANELMSGFYSCAKKENVNLIFLMRSSLPRNTNNILSDMTGGDFQVHFSSIYDYVPLFKPDALILSYGSLSIFSDTPSKEALFSYYKDIPCLLLKDISDNPDIPYLVADNYVGMCECIEHLITEHGYKKIAFLAGPAGNHDSNERLRAYHDTMQKHGLAVTKNMVAHGDFSESVDSQVIRLLDTNPGLEAIAFANDTMAKTGYRICNECGLVVGRDIAITGFDDTNMAKTLNPPLTSVMHNSFQFSYQALQNAIQLCNGSKDFYSTLPTVLHTRSSCGCMPMYTADFADCTATDDILTFVHQNIDQMVDELFFSMPYQDEKEAYKALLISFFDDITRHIWEHSSERYVFSAQYPCLKQLCEHPHISSLIMLDHVVQLLRKLIHHAPEETARFSLQRIIASTQQYVHSAEIFSLQAKAQMNLQQNWFATSFTQDLLTSQVDLAESLQRIMHRLYCMHIETCYFFLFSEPLEAKSAYHLQPPDNLYLAAYYNGDTAVSLKRSEWIPITGEYGVSDVIPQDKLHFLTNYVLFSENTQYGFLLCENKPEDIPFILSCSLQLGTFLRFCSLNAYEQQTRKELEASIRLIQEKNSILSFVSEYDELTRLLNRRGFMEKSLHAINENIDKTAYILFGDLDHLKEINDSFGHYAGDFALQTIAEYLRNCLPEDAIIARIGGDEFVAFIISDMKDFDVRTKKAIKDYSNKFNETCEQPFYVEISVGIYKCICNSTNPITDLLRKSDTLLYEEKAHRRSSARK